MDRQNGHERRFRVIRRRLSIVVLLAALGAFSASAEDPPPAASPPGVIEFVGKNAFATAEGSFLDWRIVESRVDHASIEDSFAVVEVRLESVDTGNRRRDAHLRDPDFFEVETYPVARVRVHRARRIGETAMGHPLYSADFDFDLHGVKKTLEGEIELVQRDPIVFTGRLTVDRLDFGIGSKPSRWNPMSIGAEIPVHFRVQF